MVSSVPGTFCGFGSTFAFVSLVHGAGTTAKLTSIGWHNAGIAVAISLMIGVGLGVVHGELARLLYALPDAPAAAPPSCAPRWITCAHGQSARPSSMRGRGLTKQLI